ncbi:FKBP-type peptidyl-prolyl cis-trans isomerase [Xanthovirga aplysinae]|uniref:FKBP-type peptidyl-prolyl cis-trans isomerase n=1 Tax=Xanthovirga aplysinae TaxID=2529853 RepID=UPI0012BCA362|nr:FKBP-type peptidyl-prolyl cis-trans isomerase [Xanthovirga aplysinae]MTI32407.1 hypothetical protein [Xanthovirga aplysinae]
MSIFPHQSIRFIVFFVAIVSLQSCLKDSTNPIMDQMQEDDKGVSDFITGNNIDAEKILEDANTYYISLIESNVEGKRIEEGDVAFIYYTMSVLGGNVIESYQSEDGDPIKIKHGIGGAPVGLDMALGQNMGEGETYNIYLPSYLAYFDNSVENIIPTHANLLIEVKIVEVKSETEFQTYEDQIIQDFISEEGLVDVNRTESGLYYQILEEGDGDKPGKGTYVEVDYTGANLDGTVFDSSEGKEPFRFTVGAVPLQVIPGFDEAVAMMNKGGKNKVILPSHLAYQNTNLPKFIYFPEGPEPVGILQFDIELK